MGRALYGISITQILHCFFWTRNFSAVLSVSAAVVRAGVMAAPVGCKSYKKALQEMKSSPKTMWNAEGDSLPCVGKYDELSTETAAFAMSSFWYPEGRFGAVPGVVRTRVGYSGGQEESPSYHDLKDHSETLHIQFDPSVITYEQVHYPLTPTHRLARRPHPRARRAA